mmetsp:Transcript_84555/g.237739  ORF Transcript_84555/g.237739 Transcript_84555/m.237739 type:complete len:642 (-) Transcript_84555:43-1968(-)
MMAGFALVGLGSEAPSPQAFAASSPEAMSEVASEKVAPRRMPQVPRLPCAMVQELVSFQQEDGLSPEFLRHYCGVEDLDLVLRLEIQVDSAKQSLEPLGEHLRNLRHLKLTESSVLCIRDLGTSLRNLEVLWISRCGLQDVGGCSSALPALRELYMPFNDVCDLGPLSGHDTLEVLDIEGNAVGDPGEIASLGSCFHLRELTLSGNPVMRSAGIGKGGLSRQAVVEMLPQLSVLDDLDTDPHAASSSARVGGDGGLDADDPDGLALEDDFDGLGGIVCAAGHRGADVGDEAYGADDDDDCSIEGVQADGLPRSACEDAGLPSEDGRHGILPLNSQHPMLAAALQRCAEVESTLPSARYSAAEPDEDELVTERVKLARPKANMPHAHTARPAVAGGWFKFQTVDRRQVWGSDSVPASFRPGTASARPGTAGSRPETGSLLRPSTSSGLGGGGILHFEDMSIAHAQGCASDLTCGDSLAGGALALMRHRRERQHNAGNSSARDEDMDIRELLRKYQTFTQPSCLPASELRSRKLEAAKGRPCTPDVRIHVVGQERPQSSGGLGRSGGSTSSGLPRPSSGLGRGPGSSRSGESGGAPDTSPGGSVGGYSRRGSAGMAEAEHRHVLKTASGEALLLDTETPLEIS